MFSGRALSCWAVFLLFSMSMIFIGTWLRAASRRRRPGYSNLDFWMANRETPGWQLGVSLTSGWLMLGWIGFGMSQIYAYGATGLWLLQIPWFLLCIMIIFLVSYYRRVAAISLPQAIGRRFGNQMRYLVAIFSIFIFISWAGAELVMVKTLAAPHVGMESHANIFLLIFILPIIIYTVTGGFKAIILTDVIQFVFMAVFMIVLVCWALWQASTSCPDGIISTLRSASPPRGDAQSMFDLGFLGWIFPLCMLIGYLPGWLVEQDLALRMQAAPTTVEARKGAITGFILISVFVIVLPAITAFCALAVFPPGTPKAEVLGGDFTRIILAFIQQMPDWLVVFMFLGVVTCQMSTVDTFANVAAMPLAYDLICPLGMKGASREKVGAVAKVVTALVLLASLAYAIMAEKLGDVYYLSSGILSASVAVPAIAVYWKRATFAAVFIGSIAGAIATLACYRWEYYVLQAADPKAANYYAEILPAWLAGGYGYFYICAGVVVSVLCIAAGSFLTRHSPKEVMKAVDAVPQDGASPIEAVCD